MQPVLTQFARHIQEMSWSRAEEPDVSLSPLGGVVVKSDADIEEVSRALQNELKAELIPAPKTTSEAERRFAFTTAGGKNVILILDGMPTNELLGMLRQISDFNDISDLRATKRKRLHPQSRVLVVFPRWVWKAQGDFPFIDLFGSVCRLDLE